MKNYCRHVKENGVPCGSPPLRGENYCHFHLRYKGYPLRTWPNQRRIGGAYLTPGKALNLKTAQGALKRLDRALSSGTCPDAERVGVLRNALQLMISCQRYMQETGEIPGPTFRRRGVPKEH